MPAELLKMYPAKYHRLLSHFHKENIQKCIAPYNNGDITLLTNAYPDSHSLSSILFDFFHTYNKWKPKRLQYFLLFNSLSKQQTKPVNFISHICAFSRGALNVRSTRSHPTLAPRPQICLIGGNGFCAVAGEGELNRRGDLGTEADVFCLLENDWE